MTTTPNMSLVLPTDHGSADVWDSILDTVFGLLDSHDHTSGKGVQVPSAALKINADVSWSFGGTNYALKDAKAIDFTPVTAASIAALSSALYVDSSDSELHFLDASARNIKITNAGVLNVSIVGGIGGDYSSVGALFSFDDATDSYWAQQQGSPRPWARLRVGDVDIYQTAASITNRVRLKSPAALGASYDVTWPAAVPGSTSAMQMSSAGVLTVSNTFANAITLTSGVTGAVLATGTVTGNRVVSTTDVAHGNVVLPVGVYNGRAFAGSPTFLLNACTWTAAAAGNVVNVVAQGLLTGDRIRSVKFFYTRAGGTLTFDVRKTTGASMGDSSVASTTVASGTSPTSVTISSIDYTLAADESIVIQETSGASGDVFGTVLITYDRP
jgi:hypothetical protein